MITQTILPVVDPANTVIGVVAISATQFVDDETSFAVPIDGNSNPPQYPMRKVSVLRPDSVQMEFMALAFSFEDIRRQYHSHVAGFALVEEHVHQDGWVFATLQHIPPHRSKSALEKMLDLDSY